MNDPQLDAIVKDALTAKRWDEVRYAPLCDDRTNELICIHLELIRMLASTKPTILFMETMEPFAVYALRRLNTLFRTNIEFRAPASPADNGTPADGAPNGTPV